VVGFPQAAELDRVILVPAHRAAPYKEPSGFSLPSQCAVREPLPGLAVGSTPNDRRTNSPPQTSPCLQGVAGCPGKPRRHHAGPACREQRYLGHALEPSTLVRPAALPAELRTSSARIRRLRSCIARLRTVNAALVHHRAPVTWYLPRVLRAALDAQILPSAALLTNNQTLVSDRRRVNVPDDRRTGQA